MGALSLCGSSVQNTGELACDKSRGVLKKLFIFNGAIAAADYATEEDFLTTLITNSKLSKEDSNKVFVINEAQDIADASEANKEASLNLGFKAVVQEGKPAYKIKVAAGSDLLKRLRSFNGQTVRIIECDADGVFWLTKSGTEAKGFQAKLFTVGNKISDGQNINQGFVEITVSVLSTSEYFDNAFWVETPAGGNIEDIKALIDTQLTYVSNASNVHKVSMLIPGASLTGAYNVGPDYGTEIAAETFTAFTGATYSTSLAIDTVTYNASEKCLVVTFGSTPYAALSSGAKIKLVPPTPATLDAADITGIELLPVILTK